MRKRRSIITTILALLVLLTALPAFSLKAQAAENLTAKAVEVETLEEGSGKGVAYVLDGKGVVYCLNNERLAPSVNGTSGYARITYTNDNLKEKVGEGTTALEGGETLRRKLIAIILKGYNGTGSNSFGINGGDFRAATQYAIWYWTDNTKITDCSYFLGRVGMNTEEERTRAIVTNWSNLEGLNLTDEEKAQVEKAKKIVTAYEALRDIDPKTVGDDRFYAHHELEIYEAFDLEGNPKYEKMSLDGSANEKTRRVYYQRLAGVKTIVEDPYKEVLFSKDDANGSKEIAGAKLTVSGKDSKGVEVNETWTSEEGKSHKVKLYEGTYTMTEITAPDGYEIAESITFRVVKDDNGDLKVEIKDGDDKWVDPQSEQADNIRMKDKRWTTPVNFSKTAVNGTEELPGATLKVVKGEGTDGELVSEWKSTKDQKKIDLEMGTYTMIEITAPKGYEKAESIIFRVTKDKKIEIKQPDGSWATLDQSVVHMEDAETPEEPKKEDPKPEEPKKEDPKPEEPKKEDPKPQQPEQPSNPAPEQPAVDTPDPVQPAPTPAPAQDNVAVLGATRTEDNVEQVADPGQAAVLGSRRSPETADPAPLTTLVILAGSSLVGILTLLVVWHDANHAPRKKRR